MTVDEFLKNKKMTKYRLAKLSGLPYTTVSDICDGKTEMNRCSAETVYKIAAALNVSMEELLEDYLIERPDFELFKSNICQRVKEMGDVDFVLNTLESGSIRRYFYRKWYPESLYLLAMTDYLSRINGIPLCRDYDDIRRCRLSATVFPAGVIAMCAVEKSDSAREKSIMDSIPEFIRFNIAESEIRNVV